MKLVEMATFVVHLFLVKLAVNQKIVPVSRGEYSLKENVHQEDTVRASSIVCTLQSLLIWFVRSCYGDCERKIVDRRYSFKETESNEIMLKLLLAVISLRPRIIFLKTFPFSLVVFVQYLSFHT